MAEFVDSLIAELSPNGVLSRNMRTSHPGMKADNEPRNQTVAGLAEETGPSRPEKRGSSNADDNARREPFAGRGAAAPVSGQSPGPEESGLADPPGSR